MHGRHAALLVILYAPAAFAADRPVAGDLLRLHDGGPGRRVVRFRAARDAAIDPASVGDPRVTGATFSVRGHLPAGDGAATVALPAAGWTGLGEPPGRRGWRFRDAERTRGVRTALFRPGPQGGKLVVNGGGAAWPLVLATAQAGPMHVRFAVGADVWCARFPGFDVNAPGVLRATPAPAPPACATCGDGVAEGAGEECDDGNVAGGDGCSAACRLEDPAALCAGVASAPGAALGATRVAAGFTKPVFATAPPLDPHRVFVVEKGGTIRVVREGVVLPTPFLDLTGELGTAIEQGLLGLAFDPDYETNGWLYVRYTRPRDPFAGRCAVEPMPPGGGGDNVLARFTVSADPDVADESSRVELLVVDHPTVGHNGGLVTFGPDGMLYLGIGDGGGSGGDPCEVAQDDLSPLGKLHRVNPGAPPPIDPLTTIWAKGLRNPWRFSFDRLTGDLYVGDVGQNEREEVSAVAAPVPAGVDFQWDDMEGRQCFEPPAGCLTDGTPPVLEYGHPPGCAVTAGYVYRGCALPALHGRFFYTDYCDSVLRSFAGVSGGDAQDLREHPELSPGIDHVVSFGEDARGELLIVDFGDIAGSPGLGEVWRLVPAP